jgi:hypothetical protein
MPIRFTGFSEKDHSADKFYVIKNVISVGIYELFKDVQGIFVEQVMYFEFLEGR